MSYLLTLGWPWFVAACALGALVGYLTTSDVKNAPTAPGWNIIAVASALGASAAASALGVFDGRAALTVDVFLMAAIAYLIGLPLGGALKMTQAPTAIHAGKRPIVVLRGAQSEIRAPSSAPSPEPQNESLPNADSAMRPSVEPTLRAAEKLKESAAQMRVQSGKATPSARPVALSAPRGAAADDLSKIKGLGPKSVEKLHALGVFHYDQIAGWSDDNIKWIEASIGAAGRVKRNGWVEQARALIGTARAGHSADAA